MRPLRDLLRHTLIYGVGSVGVSLISFVLIPVYTRYLTTRDYGVLALFLLFQAVLTRFYDLGLTNAVGRFFFDHKEGATSDGLGVMVSTTFLFLLGWGALLSAVLTASAPWVAEILVGDEAFSQLARILAVTLFFEGLAIPALTLIRMEERSALWVTISVMRVSASLVLNVYFVVVARQGIQGIFLSGAITAVGVFVLTLPTLWHRIAPVLHRDVLAKMLSFGLPFLPVLLGILVIDLSDRYLLQWLRSTGEVGVYSVGYKFGQIMMIAVSAFSMGWAPLRYRIFEREDAKEIYVRILTLFVAVASLGTVSIAVFGDELVRVATTPDYFAGARVIPWVCASYALYGVHLVVATGMGVTKKTLGMTVAVVVAAILNLGSNLLLIPKYGMMGAAVATAASYALLAAITERFADRVYPVPYEWGRIARIVAAAAVVMTADSLLQPQSIILGVALGVGLLAVFVGLLVVTGGVRPSEVRAARAWIRELAPVRAAV